MQQAAGGVRAQLLQSFACKPFFQFTGEPTVYKAVLDSEFRAESESGLRSAQSLAGKDAKFNQSPAAEMRCVLAGWLLAGRRLAAACC